MDRIGVSLNAMLAMWRSAAIQALHGGNEATFETCVAKLAELLTTHDHAEVIRCLLRPMPLSEARTGLKCPDCGATQKRIDIQREPDGSLTIRLAYRITADKVASEIKGLISIFKSFGRI